MNRSSFGAAGILTLVALQAPQPVQPPAFRADVELYTIHVAVTDASGEPIDDLGIADFRLIEDGEEQEIVSVFPAREAPLDMAVVLDVSGSMSRTMPNARRDLHLLLDGLFDRDCVLFVSFRGSVAQALWGPPQHTDLRAMIDLEETRGATAVFDAAVAALAELTDTRLSELARELANPWAVFESTRQIRGVGGCPSPDMAAFGATARRRALVLISDGGDNESGHEAGDVVNIASLARVPILAVSQGSRGVRAMRSLARRTGWEPRTRP